MALEQSPEYQALLAALQKERRQKIVLVILGICSGLSLLYYSWFFATKAKAAFAIGGMILLVLVFALIRHTFKYWKLSRHPLLNALHFKPQTIVWVYPYLMQHHPFGIVLFNHCTLIVNLVNGKHISIRIPEQKLKGIMLMLNDQLPHASFGFNEEKKQWYSIDPHMLLRKKN